MRPLVLFRDSHSGLLLARLTLWVNSLVFFGRSEESTFVIFFKLQELKTSIHIQKTLFI